METLIEDLQLLKNVFITAVEHLLSLEITRELFDYQLEAIFNAFHDIIILKYLLEHYMPMLGIR